MLAAVAIAAIEIAVVENAFETQAFYRSRHCYTHSIYLIVLLTLSG